MRPLRDIVDELATYAPRAGLETFTSDESPLTVVPVRLLVELRDWAEHDAWDGFDEWFADVRGHGQHSIDAIKHMEIHAEYAGAWRFDG